MTDKRSKEEILHDLSLFSLEEEDPIAHLGRLTDEVLLMVNREEALPVMLTILERYPEEELGSPGPLVHAIEKCRGFEKLLLESLKRQPGTLTVWMVYKLWLATSETVYYEALKDVLSNPKATDLVKEDVEILFSWAKNRSCE